jgi:hypothetical protein
VVLEAIKSIKYDNQDFTGWEWNSDSSKPLEG